MWWRYRRIVAFLPPLGAGGYDGSRMNLDGCLTFWQPGDSLCCAYAQLFRSGVIEAVDGFTLTGTEHGIPAVAYEEELIRATGSYLKLLPQLGIEPPVIVMLSMIGVKGFKMATGPRFVLPKPCAGHRSGCASRCRR